MTSLTKPRRRKVAGFRGASRGLHLKLNDKMNIYIASSWRNQHAVELLSAALREQGHEVVSWIENNYNEDHGPDKPLDFEAWVKTPAAERSFQFDVRGAMNCDLFIYLSPGGKDAAAECGAAYASSQRGSRFPLWMLWAKGEDFGLMRKMFDRVFVRSEDLLDHTERIAEDQQQGHDEILV